MEKMHHHYLLFSDSSFYDEILLKEIDRVKIKLSALLM
jgi:hypothetical protein